MSQIHPKRRMLVLTLLVVAAVVPFIGAPGPAVAAPAKCTALQQVLGQCRKPTTTTTVAPTTTTTTPNPACGGYATVPKTGGGVWTCDFSDEFNGTTLDRSLWLPQTTKGSGFDSNDHDCFMDSPNNVSVSGGSLELTSRQEAAPFICEDAVSRSTQYTSGSVSTYQRRSVNRGRVEVRAKILSAKVQGTHTAFWMFPQDLYGGPGRGEIDIAEVYGIYSDRAIPYPSSAVGRRSQRHEQLLHDPEHRRLEHLRRGVDR